MTTDKIEELLRNIQHQNENEWIELKKDNTDPSKIGNNISALSNSAKLENKSFGYLIYGIDDKTHQPIGTNFDPKKKKVKKQELENWILTQLQPRIDVVFYEHYYQDKRIVIIVIEAAQDRPVTFKGLASIRIGSYTKKLKEFPEKERKLWNQNNNSTFDTQIAKSNLRAEDILNILSYKTYYRLLNEPIPESNERILEKLESEKFILKKHTKISITNLGAILLAKDLNEFEHLSRKAIRVIIYSSDNRLEAKEEKVGKKGYLVGFENLIKFINKRINVKEEIKEVFRENVQIYPEVAIRELIANAIIHQDYSIRGTSLMFEVFNNRIEFTNPGKPLIDTNRFIDHNPISRNEKLANVMRRLNFCEERGSGIDRVIQSVEKNYLPPPDFYSGDNYTRVTLFGPKKLREMLKHEKIRACYQHCSLLYVSSKFMDNTSLRKRFNIEKKNYPIVSRIIRDTLEKGLIYEYEKSRVYIPFWAT